LNVSDVGLTNSDAVTVALLAVAVTGPAAVTDSTRLDTVLTVYEYKTFKARPESRYVIVAVT
jgi:hypothetical protein